MQSEVIEYELSDIDKKYINEIKTMELEYEEKEKQLRIFKSEIDYKKSKLNISYAPLVLACLAVGTDYFIFKTPVQAADCVSFSFGIEASREMKNNIATTLSTLFRDKKIGRVDINGKNYYGLPEYFNNNMETVKSKYLSAVEGRRKNP